MNRELYRTAVDLFIEMLNQLQRRVKPYRCNNADVSAWNSFVKYNQENKIPITEDYIRKFIEYGMQSWFNKDVSDFNKQGVRFSWVFGKSAIKRWNALPANAREYYIRVELKRDNNIRLKRKKSERFTELLKGIRPIEERFKNEYLNTPRGLLWCQANTTLYNHKSSACTVCENKNECKEMLKVNMPGLYKLRGYAD